MVMERFYILNVSMSISGHNIVLQVYKMLYCGKLGIGYLRSMLFLRTTWESMIISK